MSAYDPDLISNDPVICAIDDLTRRVGNELLFAVEKFGPFNSPHEGWAVIKEEMDELWEHCRANTGRSREAHQEAIQVAAMALRYVMDCKPNSTTPPPAEAK